MSERTHWLKTHPEPFLALVDGRKTFEYRRDDRSYMVGDILKLEHWDPSKHPAGEYIRVAGMGSPPETVAARVTYVLHGGRFGVPEHFCVLGIEILRMDIRSATKEAE